MSAKSPKKWNCLKEIRDEKMENEKVVSAEWKMGPSVFTHDS